jgi:hypothetical protein
VAADDSGASLIDCIIKIDGLDFATVVCIYAALGFFRPCRQDFVVGAAVASLRVAATGHV